MPSTRYLIAGNWKMHGSRQEAARLAGTLAERRRTGGADGGGLCDMLLCPPAVLIPLVVETVSGSGIAVGGQDCHAEPAGAHTGDISAEMLADAGCSHVIVGHSERRADHHEGDADVRAKVAAARRAGLVPIVCIGETEEQRDAGRALEVVGTQLADSLPERIDPAATVVAYEPVWAIGTGRTATPDQIAEVHAFIRRQLSEKTGDPAAVRILYGGSTKADNAAAILAVPDVDGALVGGASLKADEFWRICESCPERRG